MKITTSQERLHKLSEEYEKTYGSLYPDTKQKLRKDILKLWNRIKRAAIEDLEINGRYCYAVFHEGKWWGIVNVELDCKIKLDNLDEAIKWVITTERTYNGLH